MLALTDSRELQGWQELWKVKAEEEKRAKDAAESKDGQVFDPRAGSDDDEDDEEDDESGTPE